MEVHHVGYLVKNLANAIKDFQDLGYKIEKDVNFESSVDQGHLIDTENTLHDDIQSYVIHDSIRKIDIIFMVNGTYRIELVEPKSKDSSVYGLMKRYSNCPYHICYCTDDMTQEVELLREKGWTLFQRPESAPAISGCQVAFMVDPSIGMIELVAKE